MKCIVVKRIDFLFVVTIIIIVIIVIVTITTTTITIIDKWICGLDKVLIMEKRHQSIYHLFTFIISSLAVWQDTCHTYKNLVYDLAHHESPIAQWLERPSGIRKVMGSTPVGGSENSFSEYFDLRTLLH